MRKEVRLSGFGGQGIVLAGIVLGRAATLHDGNYAVQTQSYGPQARGGACKSDVIIGNDEIRYPRVGNADFLVTFSQTAYDKYRKKIHDGGGIIILDSDLVNASDDDLTYFKHNGIKLYLANAIETAGRLGNEIAANMVMLGVLSAITEVVSKNALVKVVKSNMSKPKIDLNLKAIEAGYKMGVRLKNETA